MLGGGGVKFWRLIYNIFSVNGSKCKYECFWCEASCILGYERNYYARY